MSLRGHIHLLPATPRLAIIVTNQRLDIERAIRGRLKDHNQRLAIPRLIPRPRNTIHTISALILRPVQTLRCRPRRTPIIRPHQHGALVVMRKLLRIRELDLARPTTQSHKRFPDTQGGGLLCGLGGEGPAAPGVRGTANSDAEVCRATRANIVVTEGREDSSRSDLEKVHVVNVALAAGDFAMVGESLAVILAD